MQVSNRPATPLRIVMCWGLLLTLALTGGCGKKRKPVAPPVPPTPPSGGEVSPGELEGLASYYGDPHHGRPTASGEIFDKHAMTAAHRTLPFQTRVRVHNLENDKSVDVRINDRGPFVAGRIIDLSEEAGKRLGLVGPGVARVRLEILTIPENEAGVYAVQVGAFSIRKNADDLRRRLEKRYGHVTVTPYDSGSGTLYRVRVGAEPSLAKINQLARKLQGEDVQGMIVLLDAKN
ncbi:MAG: septal ring lytic transglycosylase RlpA family protein [Acidobacteriia bacterium]|nr:septal ring lytic transglycosylase RlpA family protein [Terriglobia bacterium]